MTTKDEALKLALEALESCSAGDYSTGHVIHPSFDVDAVNRAIDAVDEALAEQPAQQVLEHAPCQGMNCGITRTDQEHSMECQAEHAAAIAGGTFVKPAQQQEPVAGKPLPCPFCGHKGLDFDEGSTYRWGVASCSGCGASCGEIRREYPDQGQWHTEAIAEWNRRTPQPASKPWMGLTDKEYQELHLQMGAVYFYQDYGRAIEAKLREKNA